MLTIWYQFANGEFFAVQWLDISFVMFRILYSQFHTNFTNSNTWHVLKKDLIPPGSEGFNTTWSCVKRNKFTDKDTPIWKENYSSYNESRWCRLLNNLKVDLLCQKQYSSNFGREEALSSIQCLFNQIFKWDRYVPIEVLWNQYTLDYRTGMMLLTRKVHGW